MNERDRLVWLKLMFWLPIGIVLIIVFAIYRAIERIVEVIKREFNTCKPTVSS